jgi:hypothetical protein
VRILHFVKGELREEFIVLADDDEDADDYAEKGFSLRSDTNIGPEPVKAVWPTSRALYPRQ